MKRGYRLNSTASFNRYTQSRTANFFLGQGILKAGVSKIDDGIKWAGRGLDNKAFMAERALKQTGKGDGLRANAIQDVSKIGMGIRDNASTIRNGIGIAGGLGAVGLGGAALANRKPEQPRMY